MFIYLATKERTSPLIVPDESFPSFVRRSLTSVCHRVPFIRSPGIPCDLLLGISPGEIVSDGQDGR